MDSLDVYICVMLFLGGLNEMSLAGRFVAFGWIFHVAGWNECMGMWMYANGGGIDDGAPLG